MKWINKPVNVQNIQHETDKAVLIKMPNKSDYKDYVFWHPKKLVRNGSHSYEIIISFNSDFTFNLKKYGQGRFNSKEIIREVTLSFEQFNEISFYKTN